MNNCDLLCEIEKLSNHIECLEYEKWDVMWQNGKYKKQLKNKNDKIKKLKKQLDQQKEMWNELRSFLDEDKLFEYFAESSVDGYKNCLLSIKNKMQELEQGEKDE